MCGVYVCGGGDSERILRVSRWWTRFLFLGRRLLPANTLLSTEANIDAEEEDEEEDEEVEKEKPANRRDKGREKKKNEILWLQKG